MKLVGKKFLVNIQNADNPLSNKVITIIHQDKRSGYVFYIDENNNDYQGKIWHIEHRIQNNLWVEVK
jgi:hypothetical protein